MSWLSDNNYTLCSECHREEMEAAVKQRYDYDLQEFINQEEIKNALIKIKK
jgi:hypothetical protein